MVCFLHITPVHKGNELCFLFFWSNNITPRLALAVPGQCGLGEATCYWQALVCWLQSNIWSLFFGILISLILCFPLFQPLYSFLYDSFSRHRRLITEIIKSGTGELTWFLTLIFQLLSCMSPTRGQWSKSCSLSHPQEGKHAIVWVVWVFWWSGMIGNTPVPDTFVQFCKNYLKFYLNLITLQ